MGLAGIMFWAPDLDDFTGGLCSEGKYPLMNTAVNLLRGNTELITSTKTPVTVPTTTTVPAITTTESPTDSKQRRIVCYYTKYCERSALTQKLFIQKFPFVLVGHNIVQELVNSNLKILIRHYVHISYTHLL